ncbi:hypothetical protein Tco_1425752, partial [Tanacetum coccineum]
LNGSDHGVNPDNFSISPFYSYELPDSHCLLEGLDKREPDDPSPYLLAIWTHGTTSRDLLLSLKKAYAPYSTSREYTLKTQLLRIKMHGDETPDDYLNRTQEYADAFAVIGEPVKDKDIVMLVVSGLRKEYNGLKTTITARQSLTSFSELHALLSDHDYMLGKTLYRTCNRCGIGHIPSQCPNRDPSTICTWPSANFANTYAQSSNASTNWHSDTGSNSHVTPDLEAMDN